MAATNCVFLYRVDEVDCRQGATDEGNALVGAISLKHLKTKQRLVLAARRDREDDEDEATFHQYLPGVIRWCE